MWNTSCSRIIHEWQIYPFNSYTHTRFLCPGPGNIGNYIASPSHCPRNLAPAFGFVVPRINPKASYMWGKFSVTFLHPSPGKDSSQRFCCPAWQSNPEAWLFVIRINATLPNGWLCLSVVFSPHWVTWNELCSFLSGPSVPGWAFWLFRWPIFSLSRRSQQTPLPAVPLIVCSPCSTRRKGEPQALEGLDCGQLQRSITELHYKASPWWPSSKSNHVDDWLQFQRVLVLGRTNCVPWVHNFRALCHEFLWGSPWGGLFLKA